MTATPSTLAKAAPGALALPKLGPPVAEWEQDGFTCRYFRTPQGLGWVTVTGNNLPMPWHEMAPSEDRARALVKGVVGDLKLGRSPQMGVFKPLAKAVRSVLSFERDAPTPVEDMLKARRNASNRLPTDVEKRDTRGRVYYGPPDKPKGGKRGQKAAEAAPSAPAPAAKKEEPAPKPPPEPGPPPEGRRRLREPSPSESHSRDEHDEHDGHMVRYHQAMERWHYSQAGEGYTSVTSRAHHHAARVHGNAAASYLARLSEKKPTPTQRASAKKASKRAKHISELALHAAGHDRRARAAAQAGRDLARTRRMSHLDDDVKEHLRQEQLHDAAAKSKLNAIEVAGRSTGRHVEHAAQTASEVSQRAGGHGGAPLPDAAALEPHMAELRPLASARHPAAGGGTGSWSGSAKHLAEAIRHVERAAATESVRFGLNGLHTEVLPNGHLRIVATDGHRLHMADVPGTGTEGSIHPGMLTQGDTLRALTKPGGTIRIDGDTKVATHEGEFPDYRALLSDPSYGKSITFDKKALTAALTEHAKHMKGRAAPLAFTPAGDQHRLRSHNGEGGHHETHVPSEGGIGDSVGFNPKFLLEAIKHTPGERVHVNLHHPLAPATVTGDGNSPVKFSSLVMPMRLASPVRVLKARRTKRPVVPGAILTPLGDEQAAHYRAHIPRMQALDAEHAELEAHANHMAQIHPSAKHRSRWGALARSHRSARQAIGEFAWHAEKGYGMTPRHYDRAVQASREAHSYGVREHYHSAAGRAVRAGASAVGRVARAVGLRKSSNRQAILEARQMLRRRLHALEA